MGGEADKHSLPLTQALILPLFPLSIPYSPPSPKGACFEKPWADIVFEGWRASSRVTLSKLRETTGNGHHARSR